MRIEVPLAWPGILTAAILAFAHTLGEFGVVLMVGGNLPGQTRTLSVAIYDRMQAFDDRGAGVMAATLLVVAVTTLRDDDLALPPAGATPWLIARLAVAMSQPGPIPLELAFTCGAGDVLGHLRSVGQRQDDDAAHHRRPVRARRRPRSRSATTPGPTPRRAMSLPPHRRRAGFVFQEYALFPHLTALDNVRIALRHRPASARTPEARRLLEQVRTWRQEPAPAGRVVRRRKAARRAGPRPGARASGAAARRAVLGRRSDPCGGACRIWSIRSAGRSTCRWCSSRTTSRTLCAWPLTCWCSTTVASRRRARSVTSPRVPMRRGWVTSQEYGDAVFDAAVAHVDPHRGLAEVRFDGGTLFAPDASLSSGLRVRVRIPARDVILATDVPAGLSLHNALPATVTAVAHDDRSGHVIVQLAIGNERLLAEVTQDAVARLDIREGRSLYGLIKSVSLQVLPLP